jgi:hypothetical protein
MPCNDRGVPCHWVTANLCSACCRAHCQSIFALVLDARQRQGIANAAIRHFKLTQARTRKALKLAHHFDLVAHHVATQLKLDI